MFNSRLPAYFVAVPFTIFHAGLAASEENFSGTPTEVFMPGHDERLDCILRDGPQSQPCHTRPMALTHFHRNAVTAIFT
jgi:hypothetical protein